MENVNTSEKGKTLKRKCCYPANKLPKGQAALNRVINAYKCGSKRRCIPFNLNKKQMVLLFRGNCFYCGCKPSKIMNDTKWMNGGFIYNGIDRLNNNIGYNSTNCVSCCYKCNVMKNTLSKKEFLQKIYQIHNFQFLSPIFNSFVDYCI